MKEYEKAMEYFEPQVKDIDEKIKQFDIEIKKLVDERDSIKDDNDKKEKLTKIISELENDKSKLNTTKSQYDNYKVIKTSYQNKIDELNVEIIKLKEEKKENIKSLDEMKSKYKKEIQHKKNELSIYQEKIEQISTMVKEAKNDKNKTEIVKRKLEEIKKDESKLFRTKSNSLPLITKYSYKWVVDQVNAGADILKNLYIIDKELYNKCDLIQKYQTLCEIRTNNIQETKEIQAGNYYFPSMDFLNEEIENTAAELGYKENKIKELENDLLKNQNCII